MTKTKTKTKNTGQFKAGESGNPAGRPKGSSGISKLRAGISEHVPDIIAKMVEKAKEGDSTAARLLLERAIPALRPTDHPEPLSIPGATLTEQGNAVIAAIASGELAPVQGGVLLAALANLAKLTEADDLEKRIAALEARNGKEAGKP